MSGTPIEHALARLVAHLRGEAEARARLQDQRIRAIEQSVCDTSIAGRVMRGQKVPQAQWLQFVRQLEGGR